MTESSSCSERSEMVIQKSEQISGYTLYAASVFSTSLIQYEVP